MGTNILKCLYCPGDRGQVMKDDGWDQADISCQLCDRYYGKGKLFLNNVG